MLMINAFSPNYGIYKGIIKKEAVYKGTNKDLWSKLLSLFRLEVMEQQ